MPYLARLTNKQATMDFELGSSGAGGAGGKQQHLDDDRVARLPVGKNLVEDNGKACTHEVAWPPGQEGSLQPPSKREGPPAREYPFKIDPFQQTAINALESGERQAAASQPQRAWGVGKSRNCRGCLLCAHGRGPGRQAAACALRQGHAWMRGCVFGVPDSIIRCLAWVGSGCAQAVGAPRQEGAGRTAAKQSSAWQRSHQHMPNRFTARRPMLIPMRTLHACRALGAGASAQPHMSGHDAVSLLP